MSIRLDTIQLYDDKRLSDLQKRIKVYINHQAIWELAVELYKKSGRSNIEIPIIESDYIIVVIKGA